jgi:hypothetical protein
MLPRSERRQQNTHREKTQQQQNYRAESARVHRFCRQKREDHQQTQRHPGASGAAGSKYARLVRSSGVLLVQTAHPKFYGAQGRIRTSVDLGSADLQSAAINRSATCAQSQTGPYRPRDLETNHTTSFRGRFPALPTQRKQDVSRDECGGKFRASYRTSECHQRTKLWSWRRDLNPRPSDYKSDALPAELRQPLPL